jgi:hypothetical protein
MRTVRRATTTVATVLTGMLLLGATATSAAAPQVELDPGKLSRGPDVAVPHVEGDDFVDGARRVDLPGKNAVLLGASGDAYVVGTSAANGAVNRRILRVEADGSLTTLLTKVSPYEVVLSEDGSRLVAVRYGTRRASPVTVWSATTGARLAQRSFRDFPSVLAATGGRVLLSSWDRGVFWWRPGRPRTRTVTDRPGGIASIDHDLLATYTGDPYMGGCTVLSRLTRPGRVLWRSCRERVDALSPDGTRMATIGILVDGIGPSSVTQREVDGTPLASYSAYWFGRFSWEDPTTMLLETHGRKRSATVRCDLADCEDATDPEPTVMPRPGTSRRSVLTTRLMTRGR